jgi:hypothetical protein
LPSDPSASTTRISGASSDSAAVEKGKATRPISLRDIPLRGDSLLDARELPDADENYSENERALSEFFRLHPMLT